MLERSSNVAPQNAARLESSPRTSTQIDAAYLSVPFEDRATAVWRMLEHCIPTLVEGPITNDPAIANRIRDLSIVNAVPVMETIFLTGRAEHRVVLDLLRSGVIGHLHEVRGQISSPLLACDEDDSRPGWHDLWMAGALVTSAVRRFVGSEPTSAVGWAEEDDDGVEHSISGILRFKGGISASVAWSRRPGLGAGYTLIGDRGTIHAPKGFLADSTRFGTDRMVVATDLDGLRQEHHVVNGEGDPTILDTFAETVSDSDLQLAGLHDIVANCEAMHVVRMDCKKPAPRQRGRQWNLSPLA